MHVCFFNRSYWPDVSATGQLLTELAEDLVARHGWEVTVVTGFPLGDIARPPSMEERRGVRIIRAGGTTFNPRRFAGRAANYVTYFLSALLSGSRIGRPDVIVSLTDPPIIGLAARAAAFRAGARFVFLCQDVFPEVAVLVEDFHSPLVNRALDRVNRFLVAQAHAIVALGDTMKRRLIDGKGAQASKIAVIHNWADCSVVTPGLRDNPFAREYGLVDRFVVLHAGNIGLSQDLDIVLGAASRLRHRDDIRFVFVGGGTRKATLQAAAAAAGLDNVLFIPFQPRDRMTHSYATADVALISLREGLSGVIVPSKLYTVLASGRACVAAVEADTEVADIVAGTGCGVVIPPGDATTLAATVERLAADRTGVLAMGARARAAALSFDRPVQVAQYHALLKGLAGC